MLCHISLTEMCWVVKLTMYGVRRKNLLYIICNNLSIGILCLAANSTGPLFRYTATLSRTDSVSQWISRGSLGLWYLKLLMPEIKFFKFSNSEFVCLCHSHAFLPNTDFQSSTFRVKNVNYQGFLKCYIISAVIQHSKKSLLVTHICWH